MPCTELTRHLRRFVAPLPNPLVIYDHHNDGALFRYAMDGFEEPDADALGPYPEVAQQLLSHDALKAQIERYFSEHPAARSEEHTSELQSLMRNSYADFCLKTKKKKKKIKARQQLYTHRKLRNHKTQQI